MKCDRVDERLLSMTPADPVPRFDGEEREHLRTCARCRGRVGEAVSAFEGLAGAPGAMSPGPEYWASVVPRLRQRLEREPRGIARLWDPAISAAMMPVAAAVVMAIAIVVATVGTPEPGGSVGLASLSDAELHELRLAGTTTGLLEAAETNGAAAWTISDFIADMVSEDGEAVLYAVAEPEELLARVDDEEFTNIVSILEHR